MLTQAILVAIWAGICSMDDVGPQMLRRPLLTGTVAGIIMGDMVQGLAISATLELMWMGIGNVGAYSAPDIVAGAIIGVSLGITTGGGIATGIALGVPVSLLCQQLLIIWRSFACFLNPWAERSVLSGSYKGLARVHFFSTPVWFLIRAVPCFIAIYFGSDLVKTILDAIPKSIIDGMGVASKLIPAVGICILLLMLLKGRMWFFFLLGFMLTTYLKLPIIPITFIALAFAVLYDMASSGNSNNNNAEQSDNKPALNNTEEDYDL
ncbi:MULTISPECIES: PTS mannose/fructose/sorbose/N-acetylgalactosamine transporter subunit IIC [unclassified Gilliamella]|uniref:PTS mannose/fructose/sorbose/N-acetylgalactosamine transporter subunit IIC n=1 Tax=unclassified Gilliamella TaxID=2685620 RepID=UPI00226A1FA8|nr:MULTISPECIES: PTS sugar transporter subunit IIC [unclassified Gilliamella]MCX8641732.1 PTS sugar transporter subunit IIC [Gilliamella sp. B3835]MCX8706533.1 PTS sugar transporter subunit IIC [Gilliamella sp. B3783]MCX8708997.1 PTS sugar transporter subunit IIC [Gilliamella sp. B3780]MCX8712270.1 PTS sugar transporter subunit IIC [Gilliamella sp. B3468]MCX8714497.1 PTS sugar transporter subunit IIC [Gilliamella sp. B3781]